MESELKRFNWLEYTVFFGMLSGSALIGVYYALKPNRKEETTEDYMLGGRQMPYFPTAMSLIVRFQMESELKRFNWLEYTVFFGMLSGSALIGVYYALKPNRKEETTEDYMLGGRQMPYFPTAMSLIVSFVSGITLLGFPAEIFSYGTQLLGICFAITISAILLNLFYLPVFYSLQYKSVFEYLEKRFDKSVRSLASFIFAFSLLLYIPVVIYVPSLAFNQVTNVPISILAPVICSICVFYTSIGGLKAVVWSDALQSMFTIASMLAVILIGSRALGGVMAVLQVSSQGERLELFNLDPDPTKRNTFWTTALGSIPIHLNMFATHPASVQRYISLPTYRGAHIVTVAMYIGVVIMKLLSAFTGLIIYAKYKDCDPIVTKGVTKPGQLVPFYVMDVAGNYPGLAGLFLSGVVSAALSTMSTGLNTVAGTIFEDFIKPYLPPGIKDRQANLILKCIVVCSLMVFVVEQLGTIMQIAISLQGITAGVSLFIFTFGMTIRWGNSKGVIAGAVAGIFSTSTLAIGAHLFLQSGDIVIARKITTIEGCPPNITLPQDLNSTRFGFPGEGTRIFFTTSVPWLFRVSYLYYSLIGFGVSMAVAILVSLAEGPAGSTDVDPNLFVLQMSKSNKKDQSTEQYAQVPTNE